MEPANNDIPKFSFKIIDSFDQIDKKTEDEWDEFLIKTKGCIYLTCSWCRIWWECYSGNRHLRIIIYYSEGSMIAVFPIYLDTIHLWPVKIKVARLIGANNPERVFDPPIEENHISSFSNHLLYYLLQEEKCDIISIGPLSDECASKKSLYSAFKNSSVESINVSEIPNGVYTYFTLPQNYDDYFAALSSNQRKNRRKYDMRMIGKEYEIHRKIIRDPERIATELPRFIRLHTEQWRLQGKPGHFGAWPGSTAFHLRLATTLAHQGRTHLIKITANEEPIIYQYSYTLGNRCYWLLPAKITGKKWERFSLGPTALAVLIRCAIEEKIDFIEAGVSHYDYKSKLGAVESKISSIRITPKRIECFIKNLIYRLYFQIISIIYHKIWYRRIQPRMPSWLHFPVWETWINLKI